LKIKDAANFKTIPWIECSRCKEVSYIYKFNVCLVICVVLKHLKYLENLFMEFTIIM